MGTSNNWLKKREKRQRLIAKAKNISFGGLIAALIIGPLIYLAAVAVPLEYEASQNAGGEVIPSGSATPDASFVISEKPIKFEKKKEREKIINPKVEITLDDLPEGSRQLEDYKISESASASDDFKQTLKTEFANQKEIDVKKTSTKSEGRDGNLFIMENLIINDGPNEVKKEDDADTVARAALRKYLKTLPNPDDFDILKDTSNLKKSKTLIQLVVSTVKQHDGKWYVVFQQYKETLPVFDGSIKMIFTDKKKLLVITDNIRTDLPPASTFRVEKISAENLTKDYFDWDDTTDKIDFTDKGYYKNKPSYKIDVSSYNPLGDYEVYVDGVDEKIEGVTSNIRLADEDLSLPNSPLPDFSATPDVSATAEPDIIILDTILSRVLGKIFPFTPNDEKITVPFANEYVYFNQKQLTTDEEGYFENKDQAWYTVFLDGPFVTIRDDAATSDIEITDTSPLDPFTGTKEVPAPQR